MAPLFNRLPGFKRSQPGLEHRICHRLPAVPLWGTALPGSAAKPDLRASSL